MLHENICDLVRAVEPDPVDRREYALAADTHAFVRIGAMLEQQGDHGHVLSIDGRLQRIECVGPHRETRAILHQQRRNIDVATLHREVEWRRSRQIYGIEI